MAQCIVTGWNFAARHVSLRVCLTPCAAIVISPFWLLVKLNITERKLVSGELHVGNCCCLFIYLHFGSHCTFLGVLQIISQSMKAANREWFDLISPGLFFKTCFLQVCYIVVLTLIEVNNIESFTY